MNILARVGHSTTNLQIGRSTEEMKSKFNPAISFIRVLAMFSIIVGHLCTAYNINTFQFGSIGVEIFLFISGFLYGNYQADSWLKWGGASMEETHYTSVAYNCNMADFFNDNQISNKLVGVNYLWLEFTGNK